MLVDQRDVQQGRGVAATWRIISGWLNAATYGLLAIGLGSAVLLAVLSLVQLLSGGVMWVELLLSMVGVFVFSRAMTDAKSGTDGGQQEAS